MPTNTVPTTEPTTPSPTLPKEIGYVISSKNYLAFLDGLPHVKVNDLVENAEGNRALINALFEDKVEAFLLDDVPIHPGQLFSYTGKALSVPVGDFLLGRVVNPLIIPIDGKGIVGRGKEAFEIQKRAHGIESREFIKEQFLTGITLLDTLVPIGKGQRELVIGDAHSGKTSFLSNIIVNMKGKNVVCIYAAIGKPTNAIKTFINVLAANDALAHTVVIATSSTEPPPLIILTPHTAMTIAEYFQRQGKDVIVMLDDMGIHAKMHRELSLLGDRSPGRESYPGDIFYQQARIMERAGKFTQEFGGGSITALPVIEITLNDFTGFIPTNLMSITDGHLFFKSNLYNKDQRPAIDISLSVSRVGRQTQNSVNNLLSRRIRQTLARGNELQTLSQFSTELPLATQLVLRQKGLIEEIIRQENLTDIPLAIQSILFSLVYTSFLKDKNDAYLRKYKDKIITLFTTDKTFSDITKSVDTIKSDEELIAKLESISEKLGELYK